MERDERKEGLITARRCLEAMAGRDVETRLSLWRAAKRYARKGRETLVTGSNAPLAAVGKGGC